MKKKYPTSPAKILDSKGDINTNSTTSTNQNSLLKNEQYAKN
jgi:hypothetical protein